MSKIRISAVSYINTLPFIYGIENSGILNQIELTKDIPSLCAQKLLENKVDLGLVPVAVIPKLTNHEIVSDFCIGASGPVRSVILGSNCPLDEIKTIYLDYHSRSSVMLTRILARHFWNINVNWADTTDGFENRIKENEAGVIIGDKALTAEKKFPFVYDLAEEWIKFTNLPFVFAAWVANKKLSESFINDFNAALSYGTKHIDDMVNSTIFSDIPKHIDPKEYLIKNIDYYLDDKKTEGMKLFLKYAGEFK
ncbi:MAG: menaquinone biosynthesis protein [Bacteroidales bacterium]|nr:menaquinone biosynthesis protein [Bacteroidales bacterium]